MLGVRIEGEARKSETETGMRYGMSLVWRLLSSSVQWSLPPWESAVWTKPLMEEANADRAHPTSPSCHLSTGGGDGGTGKTGKKCKSERSQANRFARFQLITPTRDVSANARRRTGRRKVKIKESKRRRR